MDLFFSLVHKEQTAKPPILCPAVIFFK